MRRDANIEQAKKDTPKAEIKANYYKLRWGLEPLS